MKNHSNTIGTKQIAIFVIVAATVVGSVPLALDTLTHSRQKRLAGAIFSPYDIEAKTLVTFTTIPIPSVTEIQALVASGIPRSFEDPVGARASHDKFEAWGRDAITRAFLAQLETDPVKIKAHAQGIREIMMRWCEYGTYFGDVVNQFAKYGNVNLELVWFLGNLIRSATILDKMSHTPGNPAFGILKQDDKSRFSAWIQTLESRYLSASVYQAGKSNRKASQIEVSVRSAVFRGNRAEYQWLIRTVLPNFINISINQYGIIPEDTARDKYHPQFFLASVLQTLEIGKNHGIKLEIKNPSHAMAIDRIAKALAYTATINMDSQPPKEFLKIEDPRPNYEIPFWHLAPRFYRDYNLPVPQNVWEMEKLNYANPSRYDFVMMWGFNAIAVAKGI